MHPPLRSLRNCGHEITGWRVGQLIFRPIGSR
jgi:hypothetical protein